MKFTYVFLFLILLSRLAMGAPELKGAPEELKGFLYPKDTIVSISATAEETAYSDESIVNLIVTTETPTLSAGMKKNTELREKVRRHLTEKGIASDKINNSKFSSSPQYGWFGKKASYKVVNRVAILITEESHLQDIAELADQYEEIVLSGVSFKHSKEEQFNFKVKESALAKIMKKKSYYEKSLGIKLEPIRFHENNMGKGATEGAVMIEEVIVTGVRESKSKSSSMSRERDYRPAQSNSFDEVKYYASVSVDFKVVKP